MGAVWAPCVSVWPPRSSSRTLPPPPYAIGGWVTTWWSNNNTSTPPPTDTYIYLTEWRRPRPHPVKCRVSSPRHALTRISTTMDQRSMGTLVTTSMCFWSRFLLQNKNGIHINHCHRYFNIIVPL